MYNYKHQERLTAMRKQIELSEREKKDIMRVLGVSKQMLSKALRYELSSDASKRIQKIALDRGGVVQVIADEGQVLIDGENAISQTYPNGITMELDKLTGDARLMRDGTLLSIHRNVALCHLKRLQTLAQEM